MSDSQLGEDQRAGTILDLGTARSIDKIKHKPKRYTKPVHVILVSPNSRPNNTGRLAVVRSDALLRQGRRVRVPVGRLEKMTWAQQSSPADDSELWNC